MTWRLLLIFILNISFFHAQEAENAVPTEAVGTDVDLESKSEKIYNFHSDIMIGKDEKVVITEKIKVYANGDVIKRGIFRTLPLKLNINGKKLKAKYDIISVHRDGQPEPYKEENDGNSLLIYVGNKDAYLRSGVYEYELKYSTTHQIGFFDNYDEFYWNVSGTEWSFPIDSISAQLTLPTDADIIQNSCYTGVFGSKEQNCHSKLINSHTISWEAKGLQSNEGLTIAAGFNKGVFLPPPPPTFLELYGLLILMGCSLFGLLVFLFNQWKKYGIDPDKPTVYPQFNVPENLSPAALGYLHSASYKSNFVTAAIVNLAIKGYLKIEESEESGFLGFSSSKVFKLIKLRDDYQILPDEESALFLNLFSKSQSIKIDGTYNRKIQTSVVEFESTIARNIKPILKEGNNLDKVTKPALLIIGLYIMGIFVSYLLKRENVGNLILCILLLVVVSIITAIAVSIMRNSANAKFKLGCLSVFIAFFIGSFILSFIIPVLLFSLSSEMDNNFKYCNLFLLLASVLLVVYSYLIKRPSEEKLRIQSLIEGFKMYMGAAENEQLKFHNPPNFTPQLFEKYLPYAIVLGVEKIWGKKFDNLLKESAITYNNGWYMGGMMNASSFGSSLNSSLTDSISSASSQPSSSSSGGSGSSGSSGGGSSGGGGGGGGGGGW